MSQLSDALALYCRVNKISVRALAEAIPGISHVTIGRFFNGKKIESDHFSLILAYFLTEGVLQKGEGREQA